MSTNQDADPYLWLEEVEGSDALAWVNAENKRSLSLLEADPRYPGLLAEATRDLTQSDRLPAAQLIGDMVYDLLQDAAHVRGLLRRTSFASFSTGEAEWEPVLDIDALCKAESSSWVYRSLDPLGPHNRLALITLSPGGSDAAVIREFDLERKVFVDGGFSVPECKSSVTWEDESTLLVAAATCAADSTSSGYARQVCRWKRGTAFEAREPLFEVAADHMAAQLRTIWADGVRHLMIVDLVTIFDCELHYLQADGGLHKLPLPEGFQVAQIFAGRVIGMLRTELENHGAKIKAGSAVAFELEALLSSAEVPVAETVFVPAANQALRVMLSMGIERTSQAIYMSVLEDVAGKLVRVSRGTDTWQIDTISLPENGSITLVASSERADALLIRYEDFITPPSLYLMTEGQLPRCLHALQAKFDSSNLETVRHFATSADGTKIPYFVAKPKDLALDGQAPALMGAYGGFGMAVTPTYMGMFGSGQPFKTVLAMGGVYVNANIRGGGEYGPDWHAAGLFENRQRIYDDFHAVAQDLIDRGYTSAEKLGICGASNSGLLMGVAYTQRPDLYKAVLCGVPILDMKRYHKMLAGASWIGEYGDPDDEKLWPALRAYSPYHNLQPDTQYPEVFFTGSTKDDRVHPGHMRKQAALMKEQGQPYLYFEAVEGGHAGGADLQQTARLQALQAVYLFRKLEG